MRESLQRLLAWLIIVAILIGGGFFFWKTGLFDNISSVDQAQQYLESLPQATVLVFFFIQLLSVIFMPIPNNVTALAGSLVIGFWPAFIATVLATYIGSVLVFMLARTIGQKFVSGLVARRTSEKYLELINAKRDPFLVLAFLFPFFPDDIICMLAGLTQIKTGRFVTILVLTRPWGLLVACLLGGTALSLPPWLLVAAGILGFTVFVVGMKYGDQIESRIIKVFNKRFRRTKGD